jgi:hypothetical protein
MMIFTFFFVYETKGLNEMETRLLYSPPAVRRAREKLFAAKTNLSTSTSGVQGTLESPVDEDTLNPDSAQP